MDTKKPWKSRTMWVNALMGLLAAVALFVPAAEGMKTWLTGHAAEVAMGWSMLGMVLRVVTKDKIVLGD